MTSLQVVKFVFYPEMIQIYICDKNNLTLIPMLFMFLIVGLYPLKLINEELVNIIEACYYHQGIIKNKKAVYQPYASKTDDACSSMVQKTSSEKDEMID